MVFRDPTEAAAILTESKFGDVNYELLAPDGSPVFLSFYAPWVSKLFNTTKLKFAFYYDAWLILHANNVKPLSKSAAGIESRDISGGYESAFVQVAELPKGVSLDKLEREIISQTIFGSTGKFGRSLIVNLEEYGI